VDNEHRHIAIYIAGDIITSDNPGEVIKKWRLVFGLTQTALATRLNTSPSVISDYESGRRKFPGSRFIRKFVQALIEADLERGGHVLNLLQRQLLRERFWTAVIDMREFTEPVPISTFLQSIEAEVLVPPPQTLDIYGYTIVDSVKLVLEVPSVEYVRLYKGIHRPLPHNSHKIYVCRIKRKTLHSSAPRDKARNC